jgi:hypothetical protein
MMASPLRVLSEQSLFVGDVAWGLFSSKATMVSPVIVREGAIIECEAEAQEKTQKTTETFELLERRIGKLPGTGHGQVAQ